MEVLLAEDQATSRLVLEDWLREWGYAPLVCADGAQAWDLLLSLPHARVPRLALLDWMMPNLDGLELCRKIKQAPRLPFIYTILLTSKTSKADLVTGLDSGADDYLSKPVQPEELRSRLNVGARILGYQQKLLALDEEKNRFLGMAAHDLRNPLGSILGFSELLLGPSLEEDARREFLEIIRKTSKEMLVLLNNLLDISMIESGKFELRAEQDDLAALLQYRVHLSSLNAQRKAMRILTELPPPPVRLCYDPERIGQVLDNLLSNAIKYAPPRTDIQVSLELTPDYAEVSVCDQGPGIPHDKQARLFGTFQKIGARPTGGERSTGLGLAIVKKIVEAHGGNVGVESVPGQGSRFFFRLPLALTQATATC